MFRVFITDYFSEAQVEQEVLGSDVEIIHLNTENEFDFPSDISEADALMVWHANLTEVTFNKMRKCRLVARYGVGVDNIDLQAAKAMKIPVSNTPDYGTNEVADTTLALLLNLRRGVEEYNARNQMSYNGWDYRVIDRLQRLSGSTLGVIGLGRIGTAVAKRASAFGINIIYYDPYVSSTANLHIKIQSAPTLNALLKVSDHVSIHVPLTSETYGLVDTSFFNKMKPNSIIINTARGKVLKNLDVLEVALKSNVIAGAAVDVLPDEPPSRSHRLIQSYLNQEPWLRYRLIITPHSAFYSKAAKYEMRIKTAQNVRRALDNKPIENTLCF